MNYQFLSGSFCCMLAMSAGLPLSAPSGHLLPKGEGIGALIAVFGPCSAIIVGMHDVSLIPHQSLFPSPAKALQTSGGAA